MHRFATHPVALNLVRALQRRRILIVIGSHLGLPILSSYAAFWLRFDGNIPNFEVMLWLRMLPLLVLLRGLSFIPFRLYQGLWRYTGLWDLQNLVAAVASSTLIFAFLVHGALDLTMYPRSVFIIDSMLLIFALGGLRLLPRFYREFVHVNGSRRVVIFGAGDAGEMIARDMMKYRDRQPVGFVDDDPSKRGRRIHGIPVLGTRQDLPRVIASERPDEVLVAVPSAEPATIRGVVRALQPYKVHISTLPNFRDIHGEIAVPQIRSLSIEDLLARAPVGLDNARLEGLITGKRVMVTGAGGSIGSELSRQIAALKPAELILFERYENSLYGITNDLSDRPACPPIRSIIGDVTDTMRVSSVFQQLRPEIVFHAAAHKHVPLMELNVCEAVKNNIIGTRRLAEAAQRHGVERFILISTDKAVNPSSVMGATKRVAELITQGIARRQTGTRFVTVRFGNVLGSNGSVVPRFIEQIKAGGPVTVTHPDMRRFFMLITEAVQLVLHAASLDERNDLYVLDMGDQIKLVDMARHLIRLLGYVPEEEIAIRMIGLRPGEKLCEELVAGYEVMEASSTEKVLRVRTKHPLNFPLLEAEVSEVSRLALHGETDAVLRLLCRIVPTFQPGAEWTEADQWKAAGAAMPAPVGQAVLNVARAAV